MSEKVEKQTIKVEKEEEEVILPHFLHEHPFSLNETRVEDICDCCRRRFYGEVGYKCSKKCGSDVVLHEECAEMPVEITHPTHPPHHTLIQRKEAWPGECAICETNMKREVGYHCSNSDCEFHLHLRCASSMGVIYSAAGDRSMTHPSHPQHDLRSWRRPGGSCSFRCDACGTRQHGSSYACVACQYWIHESCAALPAAAQFPHHQHALSLDFHFPIEYVVFNFKCDVCRKPLLRKHWVYLCKLCRYVVHIKCAITASSASTTNKDNEEDAAEDEDVIQFPVNDIAEEMIRPFITRVGGTTAATHDGKYKFHSHDHQLTLVSSSPSPSFHDDQENSDDDDDDDDDVENDDYDLTFEQTSELVCDGCTTPIHNKTKKSPSSSSSSSSSLNYYTCVQGKYLLHGACFNLPLNFTPSPPFHHEHSKTPLKLQACSKLDCINCNICNFYTNGLFYACTECDFKADVKCASLPPTIKHAAHPQRRHHLKLVAGKDYKDSLHVRCIGCSKFVLQPGAMFYTCQKCDFVLCCGCVMLPGSADTRYLDRHALPLTYDAAVNHPEKFFCDECEGEMNPKEWMYHCRHCDSCFHPRCLPVVSGEYRNIMFGWQCSIAALHRHPLTVRRPIRKLRCDVCGNKERCDAGFHCASCDFFACGCDDFSLEDAMPID